MCEHILKVNPDIVLTEKGVSDLAQHYLLKGNVTAIRRVRKSDNNRLARAVGAKIVNRPEELQESDIGTGCGLFEIRQIGDEYWSFFEECKAPKACTIQLRGGSKDILNEIERNLHDALGVCRNIFVKPHVVPGGGATELFLSAHLKSVAAEKAGGQLQTPFINIADALEVIPRTLAQNTGANVIRLLTELKAKHAEKTEESHFFGVDGNKGEMADMRTIPVWEPLHVKL